MLIINQPYFEAPASNNHKAITLLSEETVKNCQNTKNTKTACIDDEALQRNSHGCKNNQLHKEEMVENKDSPK